ncbi:FAD-binding oxidoreductase [Catenulispora sp. NF23]|uniref:FAD-binding oxidoreductase n=1 Tax=Catenulispora pinistramenti TaxID=2705254 RepID=A0ABS5L8A4_9ACTN|nr:FAD-binding oxidoreductase [Catenulispora pinistramenti]MBS2554585.1 FAD-binding oxidoreductase [Catenulispora pinistramenti]
MIGAACAYYAARAGFSVTVVDRGPVAGGTSGAGEGNLLVSDKEPGPELALALRSQELWQSLAEQAADPSAPDSPDSPGSPGSASGPSIEYEAKGGLVVAFSSADFEALQRFAATQVPLGVVAEEIPGDRLTEFEPLIAPGLVGGIWYPQDAQVMPALATARLLQASGATLRLGNAVTGLVTSGGAVRGVRTTQGEISARFVVNAAGFGAAAVAALVGSALPVQPRRGFVLVTEPLPNMVRHKVYSAAYVADVSSSDAALQSSAVVEGTPSGPVLIGASRERVGLDRTPSYDALGRLAAQGAELFPFLADVMVQRYYCGFRPYLPDHLPAIGPDATVSGLFHACGHEGAGIGLAPATGELIAAMMAGTEPMVAPEPFGPARFASCDEQKEAAG